MNEFSSSDLITQSGLMDTNQGFSVLGPASPESMIHGCKLLFLRDEESELWPDIVQSRYPGIQYQPGILEINIFPVSGEYMRPLLVYELSDPEVVNIIKRSGTFMEEWFKAYGYCYSGSFRRIPC